MRTAKGRKGKIIINNAHLWEPGAAYLYQFDITYGENSAENTDHYTLPFGVRTIEVTEKSLRSMESASTSRALVSMRTAISVEKAWIRC